MHSICSIKYSVPKKVPIAFHKGANYDYHLFKEIIRIFKKISCLREITKTYINFTIPIEKEVKRLNKNGGKIIKNLSYNYNFLIAQDM